MRGRRWILIAVLGWLAAAAAAAEPAEAGSAVGGGALCREEAAVLKELRAEVARLSRWHDSLEALSNGTLASDVSLDDLFGDESDDKSDAFERLEALTGTRNWPERLGCAALAKDYEATRSDQQWLQRSIARTRQGLWLGLSEAQRDGLRDLWVSRQQLTTQFDELRAALQAEGVPASAAVLTGVGQVYSGLQALRLGLLRVVSGASGLRATEQAREILQIWQQAVEGEALAALPRPAELELLPDDVQAMVARFGALAQRDLGVLRRQLNLLRSARWSQSGEAFRVVAAQQAGGSGRLLLLEARAFGNSVARLGRTVVGANGIGGVGGIDGTGTSVPLVVQIFAYLLGLAAFPALAFVARWLAKPALALNEKLVRPARRSRSATQFARLTAAIPPLLPWVAGWIGLDLLLEVFRRTELVLLVVLIPLARLYIIYNVVSLAGVWLSLSVAQQAGVYVSNENVRDIEVRSARAAAIVMLPWFVFELVGLGVGASLLTELSAWFSMLALYVALSSLLTRRRSDLVPALQSFLPRRADAWVDRLLAGSRFPLLAPITVLPLLVWWVLNSIHRLLLEVDGYRKLAARGFKLRAQTAERDDNGDEAGPAVAEAYGRWFGGGIQDSDPPYIDVSLQQAIRSRIDPWLGDRTEENTLLLTGPRGIGKSRAVQRLRNLIDEEFAEIEVRYVDVPAKTTSQDSVHALIGATLNTDLAEGPAALVKTDAARTPTLVILDNAHNFFLRRVGGLEGWQALLGLTNARVANVFWLIVINDQSWAYLGNVFARDYQFRNVLTARSWTQNEIRSLILSRNQLSDYRIRYDDVLLASRGPEAGNVRNAEQRYFSLLWDACRGNPMLALKLWMTSVRTEGRTVVVGLPVEPSGSVLERLASDFQFVYAAIVIHENMTSDELLDVTALGGGVIRAALKTAFDAGFVERGADGRYRLVTLWSPTVVGLLTRKNMLHE